MSQHEDFLEGFKDAAGLESLGAAELAAADWSQGMSEVERIDLESGGYWAGLEAGREWKRRGQQ